LIQRRKKPCSIRVWWAADRGDAASACVGLVLLGFDLPPRDRDAAAFGVDVVGSDTGTHYRIHHGTQTNIEELSHGQRVCRWCFVPEGNLVAGDVMLAQKIALETNEQAALAVAHRSFVSM